MPFLSSIFDRGRKLADSEIDFWNENGYLVIENLIPKGLVKRYLSEIDSRWEARTREDNPIVIDFREGPLIGKRMRFRDTPDGYRSYVHKLNDIHLESTLCRDLCLDRKLAGILQQLLGGDPLAIATLTFERGSQQEGHFDTYYMPAPCSGEMVVSSIFLEDVGNDAGPVFVYPKSHLVPPYRFSDGNVYVAGKESEMSGATAYIEKEIETRNLKKTMVTGNAGDVLIWHGQLYHGGSAIQNREKTRKSLVTHYWDTKDVDQERVRAHTQGANFLEKEHQPIPA